MRKPSKDYDKAIQNLEQALQDPNNPIYYRGRSEVHEAAGEHALAETDRKKAEGLEKKSPTKEPPPP